MELNSQQIQEMMIGIAKMYQEKRDELAKLDAIIGDGDHGISMARGAKEGEARLLQMSDNEPVNEYFKLYGRTLVEKIGGAIGPLFGMIFTEFGKCAKGNETFTNKVFVNAIENSTNKIMEFGGAKVGDKTMVDAMVPTMEAVKQALDQGKELEDILQIAEDAAYKGLQDTIPLKARKGRSKFLQEKSMGHQDAGATSYYYLIKNMNDYVKNI